MFHKRKAAGAALAVVLSGALLFTACSGNTDTTDTGKITAEPDGKEYSFQYPDSWQVLRSDSMYAIAAPENTQANITVAGYALPDTFTSLSEYVENPETGYIRSLQETFGDKVQPEIQSGSDYDIAGHDSVCLTYHMKVGEEEYHFATVLTTLPTMGSTYLYAITYTALGEEVYNEHIGVFRDVIQSFTFR